MSEIDVEEELSASDVLAFYVDVYLNGYSSATRLLGAEAGKIFVTPEFRTPKPGDLWPVGLLSKR